MVVPITWTCVLAAAASARADTASSEDAEATDWKDDTNIVKPPVLPADASRHEGPIAPWWSDTAVTYTHLGAPMSSDSADALSLQLAIGPTPLKGKAEFILGESFEWLNDYAVRARWTYVMTSDGTPRYAPLTVAVQRFIVPGPLKIAPLIHAHLGIEAAFSTPWFDGRQSPPPLVYQRLYAVDTELADNGYSVRPFGAYVRADLQVCRNMFLETGVSPELFVPTQVDRTNDYNLHWHVAFGGNFACSGNPTSWLRPLAFAVEVRGRSRLDAGRPQRRALDSLSLQYHLWDRLVINVFGSRATGTSASGYFAAGVRLQLGAFSRIDMDDE